MKNKWLKLGSLAMATVLVAATLVGCGKKEAEKVALAGSTSMEKVCEALMEGFAEVNPDITVTTEYTGSGAGIESLIAGSVDIGNASRNIKDEEKESGVVENVIALDGIAVIIDKQNTVIGLTKEDSDIFCSDLENIEYTTNEKQTLLCIQNGTTGILFENNLDTKHSDEEELKKCYRQITSDGTNVIKTVRFFPKKDDYKNCTHQLNNSVFITAEPLSNFFIDWCYSQECDSLAKGMYSQYAKKLLFSM